MADSDSTRMTTLAWGGGVPDYNVLPDAAREQWAGLDKFLTAEWAAAYEDRKKWLWEVSGCLNKLSSAMLGIARIRHSFRGLINSTRDIPLHSNVAFAARETCTDFESLLLHSRAALDRLTWFIAAGYKQRCNRFTSLNAILQDFLQKDARAPVLAQILQDARALSGVLWNTGKAVSFRSYVAHIGSVSEAMESCFSVVRIDESRVLVLDCESQRVAVMKTTGLLAQQVPFIVLNSLCTLISRPILDLDQYEPGWQNPAVLFSELPSEETGFPITRTRRMTPDGFDVESKSVPAEVFEHAIDPAEWLKTG